MPIARLSASRTGPAVKSSERIRACDCARAAVVEASETLPIELESRVDDHRSGSRSRNEFSNASMASTVDSCIKIDGSPGTWLPDSSLYLPRYSLFRAFFCGASSSAPCSFSCCVTLFRCLSDTRKTGSSTATLLDQVSIAPSFISRCSALNRGAGVAGLEEGLVGGQRIEYGLVAGVALSVLLAGLGVRLVRVEPPWLVQVAQPRRRRLQHFELRATAVAR
eukprot:scaffold6948_cov99-Isochrysis_galbana.AAC.2